MLRMHNLIAGNYIHNTVRNYSTKVGSVKSLLGRHIKWDGGKNAEIPFQKSIGEYFCQVRVNNFPEESLYSLLVNGKVVSEMDYWPSKWKKPEDSD